MLKTNSYYLYIIDENLKNIKKMNKINEHKKFGESTYGKKFLLCHFFGQIFNQNNLRFKEARILRKECFNDLI